MPPIRTLFLVNGVPFPPRGGESLRNWQNIDLMAALGPVGVFCAARANRITASATRPDAISDWQIVEIEPPDVTPVQKLTLADPEGRYFVHSGVAEKFADFFKRFDPNMVVVEGLGPASIYLSSGCTCDRLVYDAHNAQADLARHMVAKGLFRLAKAQLAYFRVKRMEGAIVAACDRIWACSEEDAARFAVIYRHCPPIDVVPNGVDVDFYDQVRNGVVQARASAAEGVQLIFPGLFTWHPNQEAARLLIDDIFPLLCERMPAAQLVFAGREPTSWMRTAAATNDAIHVTGEVADMRPYFQAADIIVVPLRSGGGTRLKILEAFASGRPVVSTAKGAEGLGVASERELLLAETAEEFVTAIARLARDADLRQKLCANALRFVQDRFSRQAARRQVERSVADMFA